MEPNKLSDKARAILEAIAKGHTYEQILVQDLAWTYQLHFPSRSRLGTGYCFSET
jgi:hypothetical protein